MVVNNTAQRLLASLGLSEYEARAYTALIAIQPASAYELARQAGMPTSKIYEILHRLTEKGMAIPVEETDARGRRFAALDPEDFLAQRKQEMTETAALLAPMLKNLAPPGQVGQIWPIGARADVIGRARQLVAKARERILVSLWPEELAELEPGLAAAVAKKVKVAVVHFGKPKHVVGVTFHHPVERAIQREKGGRGFALVADGQQAMMATFLDSGGVEGAWSRNQAFVGATEDYIRHDIYITKVTTLMGGAMRKKFGENYERLRDVFLPAGEV
ncbi:MAG: hypothetical protein OEV92_09835 [Nitrospinota bacterium]|nr:hypothetical protein [Nitrospinota bacterium]